MKFEGSWLHRNRFLLVFLPIGGILGTLIARVTSPGVAELQDRLWDQIFSAEVREVSSAGGENNFEHLNDWRIAYSVSHPDAGTPDTGAIEQEGPPEPGQLEWVSCSDAGDSRFIFPHRIDAYRYRWMEHDGRCRIPPESITRL